MPASRATPVDQERHSAPDYLYAIRGAPLGCSEVHTVGAACKNPTGHHRCWASINNADDQLFRVSRALFASNVVIFFSSVRWGQTDSVSQRLFERLSWIEHRMSTLEEGPIPHPAGLEAGMVLFGHNWLDAQVLRTQQQNFAWFGWRVPAALSFAWQFTAHPAVESAASYVRASWRVDATRRLSP